MSLIISCKIVNYKNTHELIVIISYHFPLIANQNFKEYVDVNFKLILLTIPYKMINQENDDTSLLVLLATIFP
jgi:hypothetical protein